MEASTQILLRRDAVDALLHAIDRSDLHAMELQLGVLRRILKPLPGAGSLDAERLDALTALADEIEDALRRMRTAAAGEMARIRGTAPLLAHVGLGARPSLTQH